jgi:hypothetical protein
MKTRKRQKTTAIPDFPAVSADAMAGFTVDELLDSRHGHGARTMRLGGMRAVMSCGWPMSGSIPGRRSA